MNNSLICINDLDISDVLFPVLCRSNHLRRLNYFEDKCLEVCIYVYKV